MSCAVVWNRRARPGGVLLKVESLGGWSCWEGAVLVGTLVGGMPGELVRVGRVTGGEI